jgi:manganese/zinc/iron transport system permease protein
MMGDAISHSVLPGIVIAFILLGSRTSGVVFVGAVIAGILSAILVELVQKLGRVEPGASMGVVFTVFFALGVFLMEQAAASSVDLDADCVLHGQLESIFWFPPNTWEALLTFSSLKLLPTEIWVSLSVMLLTVVFVTLFFKELRLASFDPALAEALGYRPRLLHYLLMIMLAAAVVASFQSVGAILVVAMIVCPAATARLLTDRLGTQLLLSAAIAVFTAIGGYLLGAFGPQLVGWEHSVNAAGSMAVFAGMMLAIAVFMAPHYGIIARLVRRTRLSVQIAREDILGYLYRKDEKHERGTEVSASKLIETAETSWLGKAALRSGVKRNELVLGTAGYSLSDEGFKEASKLIRSHRLWESYLVSKGGLEPEAVHNTAMQLEHLTTDEIRDKLAEQGKNPDLDPHGKEIPKPD